MKLDRHERRRLERSFNKLSYKEFLEVQKKVEMQLKIEYQNKYILTALCTLVSEFGFGIKRTTKFLNEFKKQIQAFNENIITIDDMNDVLKNLGFKVGIANGELYIIDPQVLNALPEDKQEQVKNILAI
jgi:hypothetical protein